MNLLDSLSLYFLLQIRGHNKAQLDPLGILQADLSDSFPADLSMEYWGLGKLYIKMLVHTFFDDLLQGLKNKNRKNLRKKKPQFHLAHWTSWYNITRTFACLSYTLFTPKLFSVYEVKNNLASFERPLTGKKNGVFLCVISSLISEIFKLLHYAS